jgi:hypothetical protein
MAVVVVVVVMMSNVALQLSLQVRRLLSARQYPNWLQIILEAQKNAQAAGVRPAGASTAAPTSAAATAAAKALAASRPSASTGPAAKVPIGNELVPRAAGSATRPLVQVTLKVGCDQCSEHHHGMSWWMSVRKEG